MDVTGVIRISVICVSLKINAHVNEIYLEVESLKSKVDEVLLMQKKRYPIEIKIVLDRIKKEDGIKTDLLFFCNW